MQEKERRRPKVVKKKPIKYIPRSVSRPQTAQGTSANANTRRATKPKETPPPPPIPSYLPKSSRPKSAVSRSTTNKSVLDDPNCIAMRNHFYEERDYEKYSTSELQLLKEHLREYTAHCVCQRDYDEARKSEDLYDSLKLEVDRRGGAKSPEPQDKDVPYEELAEQKEAAFRRELSDYDEITKDKRKQLQKKQSEDAEEFERHWREDMPPRYRKPSMKLLQLYEVERKLGITGQFEKAKAAKKETENVEREEMAIAQRTLVRDYTAAKQQFEKEQAEERELFENTRSHWREVIVARQKVEFEAITNRGNVLNIKQNPKSSRDGTARGPKRVPQSSSGGNPSVYHRENFVGTNNRLLPPLIPPNDTRIKEMSDKEKEEKNKKNKQFREYRMKKDKEADNSEVSESSSDAGDCGFLLPAPKLTKPKGNKKVVKKTQPPQKDVKKAKSESETSSYSTSYDSSSEGEAPRESLKEKEMEGNAASEKEGKVQDENVRKSDEQEKLNSSDGGVKSTEIDGNASEGTRTGQENGVASHETEKTEKSHGSESSSKEDKSHESRKRHRSKKNKDGDKSHGSESSSKEDKSHESKKTKDDAHNNSKEDKSHESKKSEDESKKSHVSRSKSKEEKSHESKKSHKSETKSKSKERPQDTPEEKTNSEIRKVQSQPNVTTETADTNKYHSKKRHHRHKSQEQLQLPDIPIIDLSNKPPAQSQPTNAEPNTTTNSNPDSNKSQEQLQLPDISIIDLSNKPAAEPNATTNSNPDGNKSDQDSKPQEQTPASDDAVVIAEKGETFNLTQADQFKETKKHRHHHHHSKK